MNRTTKMIETTLGTGVWGNCTAERTKNFIRRAIEKCKATMKTLDATIITVSNEKINILVRKGTEKQIKTLAEEIRRCVITIKSVEITG